MYDWRSAFYDASYDSYVAAVASAAATSKNIGNQRRQSKNLVHDTTVSLNENFITASNSNLNMSDEYVYVYNIDENNKENDFFDGNYCFLLFK
jgi:hypothetical protein